MQILGVDPGIAHTAIAVVDLAKHKYKLRTTQLVKTSSSDETGKRLDTIHDALSRLLDRYAIDGIAVEKVFHNKNISSSISTGKVIGLCELTAYNHDLPVYLCTPQQIKACSGLGANADKATMIKVASRLFRTDAIGTHHEADACFCAVAGLLQARKLRNIS